MGQNCIVLQIAESPLLLGAGYVAVLIRWFDARMIPSLPHVSAKDPLSSILRSLAL